FMQITYCIRMLQQTYPSFRSPKLDFFNTFDRAMANFKGQNVAHDLIPWDSDFHSRADSQCNMMVGVSKNEKL
ncbi:hypothetical protein SAMN02745724_03385, partial [Pseudoalteromonas denitrificans DSM 6059]